MKSNKRMPVTISCLKCGRMGLIDIGMGLKRCRYCGSEYSTKGISIDEMLSYLANERHTPAKPS